jgi:hypothetical protein
MVRDLSPRLAAIVKALPLRPGLRVLEIGCGPGVASRAVAHRLGGGQVLGIDRSAKAIARARAASKAELAAGYLRFRHVAVEDFELEKGEMPYDIAFAVRVGALDGRHPEAHHVAMQRIRRALVKGGHLYIDGGQPLRELPLGAEHAAAVRDLARILPNVEEGDSAGLPAFKVKGRLMAWFREDPEVLAVKMSPINREYLLRVKPETFFITDHYRDYPIVLLRLPRIGRRELAEVLEEGWRQVAPKRMRAAYDAEHGSGTKRRAT